MSEQFQYPPIFVSSGDSYSDLWELFFTLFKKYWPEYSGTIYFNTQEKEFSYPGLNIVCTKTGNLGNFGALYRSGLDCIKSEFVLIMMIDHIFMGKVNDKKIREYYSYFKNNDLDTLNFLYYPSKNQSESDHPDLMYIKPPALHQYFNLQNALWKKSVLHDLILPHENPWTAEWYGSYRAEKINIKQVLVKKTVGSPIPYHPLGCLTKGKWHPVAVAYLKKEQLSMDYTKRGLYTEQKQTLMEKIIIKCWIIKDGLKGSYFDVWKRKKIQ